MKHGRFDFEKNKPIFQTPKYTGVTLSLLSMFVLVCMFAVWEKMPKQDTPDPLLVSVPEIAFQPVHAAQKAFEQELGVELSVQTSASFLENQKMYDARNPDLWIFESDSASSDDIPVFNQQNSLVLAHKDITDKNLTLAAGINLSSGNSVLAFQFARYLAAPSRGQFNFAEHGWTGVDSDRWYPVPEIKIWVEDEIFSKLDTASQSFEKLEGVIVSLERISKENIMQSLEIIHKSKSRKFLPDLIWVSDDLSSNIDLEKLAFSHLNYGQKSKKATVCLINEWSILSQTGKRFFYYSAPSL